MHIVNLIRSVRVVLLVLIALVIFFFCGAVISLWIVYPSAVAPVVVIFAFLGLISVLYLLFRFWIRQSLLLGSTLSNQNTRIAKYRLPILFSSVLSALFGVFIFTYSVYQDSLAAAEGDSAGVVLMPLLCGLGGAFIGIITEVITVRRQLFSWFQNRSVWFFVIIYVIFVIPCLLSNGLTMRLMTYNVLNPLFTERSIAAFFKICTLGFTYALFMANALSQLLHDHQSARLYASKKQQIAQLIIPIVLAIIVINLPWYGYWPWECQATGCYLSGALAIR